MLFPVCGFSRRAAFGTAAALCSGCSRRPAGEAAPKVAAVRSPAYDNGLYTTLRRLLGELNVGLRGKNVLLKPNLVEFDSASVINTHPVFVHAALEACRAAGAAGVRIAEGPGHRRPTLDLAEAAGYFSEIPGFEKLFTDLNLDAVSPVRFRRPLSRLASLYLPNTALAADVIVSLPKMKTHHWVGATLSMKNFFGLVPGAVYGWPKNVLHWAGIEQSIADLCSAFPRHFAIVDGIEAMEGNGPIQGRPKHVGVVVAGENLVAVDATCCRIMGIDPRKIGYLTIAEARAETSESGVLQVAEPVAALQTSFELIPQLKHLRLPGC